jgi:hypothetical protein
MSQAELSVLGRAVRASFPDTPLVCAGLASGQPGWLDEGGGVDLSSFDALAYHPYIKDAPNPDDLEDLPDVTGLHEAYGQYGLPLLITEWGWWSGEEVRAAQETREMVNWAGSQSELEVFFYFCLGDFIGPGVLAKMAERGDAPASCERYETGGEHNQHAEYSKTMGRSGAEYRYLFDTNEVRVSPTEAG